MPRVDELLDLFGSACFNLTLDLTKGYWQIPLSPFSQGKTAFTMPFGLHQFITLPFGLFGAPATFQHLMVKILLPHSAYAACYAQAWPLIHPVPLFSCAQVNERDGCAPLGIVSKWCCIRVTGQGEDTSAKSACNLAKLVSCSDER